jgi:hypothetical protein
MMGSGPWVIGALADYFTAESTKETLSAGGEREGGAGDAPDDGRTLGAALCIFQVGYIWAAAHFVLAARTIRRDVLSAAPSDADVGGE